jgi:hypothetical protein
MSADGTNGIAEASSLTDEAMLPHLMAKYRQRMLSLIAGLKYKGHQEAESDSNFGFSQKARKSVPNMGEMSLFQQWVFHQPHASHHSINDGRRGREKIPGASWSYPDDFPHPPSDDEFWRDGMPWLEGPSISSKATHERSSTGSRAFV